MTAIEKQIKECYRRFQTKEYTAKQCAEAIRYEYVKYYLDENSANRFKNCLNLQPGWDGYYAKTVSEDSIKTFIELLPHIQYENCITLTLSVDGNLTLEWFDGDITNRCIEIVNDKLIHYYDAVDVMDFSLSLEEVIKVIK